MKNLKLVILFLVCFFLFEVRVFSLSILNQNIEFNLDYPIILVDKNDNELLGAKFYVGDLNDNYRFKSNELGGGHYLIRGGNGINIGNINFGVDDLEFFLTDEQLDAIYSVNTRDDVSNISNDVATTHTCLNERYCYVRFLVPVFLYEQTAPAGYSNGKYILIAAVSGDYLIRDNDDVFDEVKLHLSLSSESASGKYFTYRDDGDYENFYRNYQLGKYNNDSHQYGMCGHPKGPVQGRIEYDTDITSGDFSTCPLKIVNDSGNVDIKIESFVNNKSNITTYRGKTLDYRIVINNNGNSTSSINEISTTLPSGFKYVENSASDRGFFDKDTNTISWKVEEIGAKSKVELRYSLVVPNDVKDGVDYFGTIKFSSKELSDGIQARGASVNIVTNPRTNNGLFVAILVIILTILGFGIFMKKNRSL